MWLTDIRGLVRDHVFIVVDAGERYGTVSQRRDFKQGLYRRGDERGGRLELAQNRYTHAYIKQ